MKITVVGKPFGEPPAGSRLTANVMLCASTPSCTALSGNTALPTPGIKPTDVVTYATAVGVILAAAALASYLPARRASAIDPMQTLKAE